MEEGNSPEGMRDVRKKENDDEDSRPFARRSLLGISSPSGVVATFLSLSFSRLIDVDNNAQYAINSAGLRDRAWKRAALSISSYHTPVCSHPPFLPPDQGLGAYAPHRGGPARVISDCRSAARARSAITTGSGRYFAVI